jgi:UPF0176 protein
MSDYVVAALYKFVRLDDHTELRAPLLALMRQHNIRGTLLLAAEGINGTVAGKLDAINTLIDWLCSDARFANLQYKTSRHHQQPFYRSKVKLKAEIVTMGVEDIDPNQSVGTYVAPQDWNALIADPEVTVIDTRNSYEVRIGSFEGAVNPATDSFREFPDYVSTHLDPGTHKKVAMFCTGGIRCEKSTAYLKQQGFEEVYHLSGGILKYLEEVPEEDSLWRGECFVFDNRVTVDHQLRRGQYEQCHACRMPITTDDMASTDYQAGVSCPHCISHTDSHQRQRFSERQRQMQLAKQRNEDHLGADSIQQRQQRKSAKLTLKDQQRQHSQRGQLA